MHGSYNIKLVFYDYLQSPGFVILDILRQRVEV
jgi:hypothetical protein